MHLGWKKNICDLVLSGWQCLWSCTGAAKHTYIHTYGQKCTVTELLGAPFLAPDGQTCIPAAIPFSHKRQHKHKIWKGSRSVTQDFAFTLFRFTSSTLNMEDQSCCFLLDCYLKPKSVLVVKLVNSFDHSSFSGSCFWPQHQQIWGHLPAASGGQKEDQADSHWV